MKRMLYIALAALALAAPVERADVGKLRPVEVVCVAGTEGSYLIRTDTGDRGAGATLEEAVNDLRDRAPGIIYLDTAEYLLLENEIHEMDALIRLLKPDVRVCAAEPRISLEESGQYLDVHRPKARLKDGMDYDQLEHLWDDDGSYMLQ